MKYTREQVERVLHYAEDTQAMIDIIEDLLAENDALRRVPLTEEQVRGLILEDLFPHGVSKGDRLVVTAVIRAVERAHGIGANPCD